MKDLLYILVSGLVENKDAIKISVDPINDDGYTVYHVNVAQEEMGRIIGKQGKIAKAIRIVMRAAATKNNQKISIEIDG